MKVIQTWTDLDMGKVSTKEFEMKLTKWIWTEPLVIQSSYGNNGVSRMTSGDFLFIQNKILYMELAA